MTSIFLEACPNQTIDYHIFSEYTFFLCDFDWFVLKLVFKCLVLRRIPWLNFGFWSWIVSSAMKLYFKGSVIYDITVTSRNQHQDEIKL